MLGRDPVHASSALKGALAASLALHAAVLAGIPDLWTSAQRSARAPLNVRIDAALLQPVAAEPDVAASAERTAAPLRTAVRATRPASSPRAHPLARVADAPVQPARDPAREIEAASAPEPREAALAALAPTARAAGEPSLAPRAGDEAIDPGSLAQFRLALLGIAKRYKLYPPYAVERGWQGRVGVRLEVGADGALVAASVQRSSGHEVLDREALEVLTKASALAPIPPALKSREFSLEVPVLFELRDG